MRFASLLSIACVLLACGAEPAPSEDDEGGGTGGTAPDPNANADGDCMTDAEELELGTDPNSLDTDLDGIGDCDEVACVSNPLDGNERCYTCGWPHNDPGTLVSNGTSQGSTIANIIGFDQCGENLELWDMFGSYFIIYATGAW